MLFSEVLAVYFENHKKPVNTLSEHNAESFTLLIQVVQVVTTKL
jgi:hypothetical protein